MTTSIQNKYTNLLAKTYTPMRSHDNAVSSREDEIKEAVKRAKNCFQDMTLGDGCLITNISSDASVQIESTSYEAVPTWNDCASPMIPVNRRKLIVIFEIDVQIKS